MNVPTQGPAQQPVLLSEQEQRLVQTIRLLEEILPGALDQVEGHVWSLVSQHLKWNWSDPESLRRATLFMGLDPEIRRESQAISEEFACAEGDGLEDY
jgi:hypothetical protein